MRTIVSGLIVAVLALPAGAADDFKLEEGYTLLLNGKDLTGWKLRKGGESLDGKTATADKRFSVKEGVLVIDPNVKGDIIIDSAKSFDKDVHIKFEFKADAGCNNDLFIRGAKFDIKKGDVKNLKEGSWQTFEIVVKDKKIEFKCDGENQKTAEAKQGSPLGVRAEFGPIQIRNMRYKE